MELKEQYYNTSCAFVPPFECLCGFEYFTTKKHKGKILSAFVPYFECLRGKKNKK